MTEAVRRATRALAQLRHPHTPILLEQAARTSHEAAQALGIEVGQVAKSVVFRRAIDSVAVLVVAAGDRRVDERKVAALLGPVGRADARFVKERTGYSIGGVCPVAHLQPVMTLLDESLQRFAIIWAAAGHPHAVFQLRPDDLERITGAPWADVALPPGEQSGAGA